MTELTAASIEAALTTRRFGRPTYSFDALPSTMPEALAWAKAGAAEGTLIIADAQTAGLGRLGRSWLSEGGVNLTFSLILRPTREQLRGLPIAVSLAGIRAIRAETGLPAKIKWPNDLVIGDRKCAGILLDSEIQGTTVAQVILGFGLNVNQDVARFPELAPIATSLAGEAGHPFDRVTLLARLLAELEDCYDRLLTGPALLPEWIAASATLGRRVTATLPDGTREIGLAEAVDPDGALRLRTADGRLVRLVGGEVTLRSWAG